MAVIRKLEKLSKNKSLGDLVSEPEGLGFDREGYLKILADNPEFAQLMQAQKAGASGEERDRLLQKDLEVGAKKEKELEAGPLSRQSKRQPFSRRSLRKITNLVRSLSPKDADETPELFRGFVQRRGQSLQDSHPMDGVEYHKTGHYTITGPTGVAYKLKMKSPGDDYDYDNWEVTDAKSGERTGSFDIENISHSRGGGGRVKMAFPFGDLGAEEGREAIRTFKAGRKFYSALRHHYGKLESDTVGTTKPAMEVYRRLGDIGWARKLPSSNEDGNARWKIKPHNIKTSESRLKTLRNR
jgi:hypothetical protein